MNLDDFSLGHFEVDCDGSSCGSPRELGLHTHPPQGDWPPLARVTVRDGKRVHYSDPLGATL